MTSFLDHVHEGSEIALDLRTKNKAMMETILPMMEIILPVMNIILPVMNIILPVMNIIKSATICEPGLHQHPGHSV